MKKIDLSELPLVISVLLIPLDLFIFYILVFLLIGVHTGNYQTLPLEEPALTIQFEKLDSGKHTAFIETPNTAQEKYSLSGDQWRVNFRFIAQDHETPPSNETIRYAVDSLQSRYIDGEEKDSPENTIKLSNNSKIIHKVFYDWNPIIDIEYNNSSYHKIDTESRFYIYKTAAGIIIKSEPLQDKNHLPAQPGNKSF